MHPRGHASWMETLLNVRTLSMQSRSLTCR
uniref:Uncharacterized protein n=1 Tax=Arundo donax TaxID=35708 RepID=A0A0A8ZBR3_ARUDO